jgi:4-amino-4-deoxy-L-arabinose transferase-like glycosyltransferase
MRKKIILILAVVIVGIGALLRFYGLNISPPSLGFDEASLGYNAYSLMKTGKDEYGNFLPISLRSFNDYKPALYAYLTIPFIYFGGLNDATVRMVSALAGTVSLIFLYLLLRKFIKNKWLVLATFFILSFEPWRLHFSRNAFETHLSMAFFTIGCWWLLEKKRKFGIWWSLIFFGLSAYSYHSARLSAPMLLLLVALDPLKLIRQKDFWRGTARYIRNNLKKFLPIIGIIVICLPIFIANKGSLVLTRFEQENVFQRFYPYAPKEFVNPISSVYYLTAIISGHIFSHISAINLNYRIFQWVKMSPQFIPGMGMLGWIEGLVFMVGLVEVIRRIKKSQKSRFLIYWVVAGIAPAAATWTWFHPLRSLNIYPAMEIIVAIGLVKLFGWIDKLIKNKILKMGVWGIISVIFLVTIIFTINNELLYSAYENHGEYQPGGYKEGMPYLKSIQDNYDQVIIDTPHAQPFVFLMFYEQMDPTFVQSFADIRPKPGVTGNLTFNFGKFVFRKIDWPRDKKLKKTVFWTSPEITDEEVARVPGAKIRMKVYNALYHTADIITTE